MRDRIVAGNWKMNNDFNETEKLLDQLKSYSEPPDVKIMITPVIYPALSICSITKINKYLCSCTKYGCCFFWRLHR